MCELCSGSGDAKCDAKNEPYSGYDGAFKCLKDGAGDVAFIKEATIPVDDKANYMLLCANASMPTASKYYPVYQHTSCSKPILSREEAIERFPHRTHNVGLIFWAINCRSP